MKVQPILMPLLPSELDSDFTHPLMFSIIFDTGSGNGSVECVDIPTIDDEALEGDHDFSISLTSSSLEDNVVLSNQSVTTLIKDNDSELMELVTVSCAIVIMRQNIHSV